MKVLVSKTGTLGFNGGDYLLNQDREIFIINKHMKPENVAGSFEIKLPENFDLWGGNAESRKLVTEMLKKGKAIAAKKK
jgi:hypothetical protein